MPRRKNEAEKDNSERWLLTYSDLITLLMVFFIVLYSMSNVNAQKFEAMAASLNAALNGGTAVLDGGFISENPPAIGIEVEPNQPENAYNTVAEEIKKYLKEEGLEQKISVTQQERGLVVSIQDTVLFPKASAELTPQARKTIKQIGGILLKIPSYIRVEGHTDNLAIHNDQFKSNWELSVLRATSVVHILTEQTGLNPKLVSAIGYGEYRPVVPNNGERNYAKNRRVDIVLLKTVYNRVEPDN
ncbi:flagellar motor protein MotB [Bacillota bacterium LX-D]|nr:flagellar motor protein MotB [Bacillota bacterium LX-D]